jgi:hypothetical protein
MENEKLNREQRRRQKFGKAGKVHQHGQLAPWPESEANPALRNPTADEAAEATVPVTEDVALVDDEESKPAKTAKG